LVVTDMHKPVIGLKEKWPWFIGKKYGSAFQMMSWNRITKPLVLASLWGWRDPSYVFYLSSLTVTYDKIEKKYYGFEKDSLILDNELWWCNLPVISTAKIVLKKVEISKKEFQQRKKLWKSPL